ncbi:MAG: hypothetical protein KBC28_05825 [Alphaproteobacteria bacterium]|jgi:hypothetical protein|nr:hypothetical protein [Alphaproteobacteria bacterium]
MKHLLSILTFKISPKAFVMVLWVLFFVPLIIIIGLNLWVDPYFIFRKSPFEPRLMSIDHHQRFAKSLQVITRQPHTILLGSSRVYRGFDVGNDFYNMGISSLTLTEAASYIDHILLFTSVHTIVLGLDFWMCDKITPTLAGWDKNTGTLSYGIQSFLNALFNTEKMFEAFKTHFIDKKKILGNEGWTYEGFFRTGTRSKNETQQMLRSYEKGFLKTKINLKMLDILEEIIQRCQTKGVKLYIYISPLHPEIKAIYKQSHNASYFDPWREKIYQICSNSNIQFYDFSDFLRDSPPLSNGSNEFWLDHSHFSPKVGTIILQTLGVIG